MAFDGRSSAVFSPNIINWDNTLPSDGFDFEEVKIELKLTTHAEDGLILYQGAPSNYFISLGGTFSANEYGATTR